MVVYFGDVLKYFEKEKLNKFNFLTQVSLFRSDHRVLLIAYTLCFMHTISI